MRSILLLLSVVLALFLSGCSRTAPLYEVVDTPAVSFSGKKLTAEDVQSAILRAARQRGWQVAKSETPGEIELSLTHKELYARIVITYDADSYTIRYKDSRGLRYDPATKTIHKRFNGWMGFLDRTIQENL